MGLRWWVLWRWLTESHSSEARVSFIHIKEHCQHVPRKRSSLQLIVWFQWTWCNLEIQLSEDSNVEVQKVQSELRIDGNPQKMFLMGSYAPDKNRTLHVVLFHFDKKYQGGNSLLAQRLAPRLLLPRTWVQSLVPGREFPVGPAVSTQAFVAEDVGSIPSTREGIPCQPSG